MFGALRVLVVDDNEINRQLLEAILNSLDIAPTLAPDGKAAVEAARRVAFDLVLMDVNMPIMDGLTATHLIRTEERRRGERHTHLVVVSCNSDPRDVTAALAAGADRCLAKPFHVEDIVAIVEEANTREARGRSRRPGPVPASPSRIFAANEA